MSRPRILEALMGLALGVAAASSPALSGDRDQPIEIEADRAELDEQSGTAVYSGTVIVTQGTLRVTGERLTLHFDASRQIEKASMTGAPARFRQRPDDATEDVEGSARTLEYRVGENLMYLINGAKVVQGGDSLSGNQITYDTEKNRVQARKAESGDERVRITLTPRKKEGAAPESEP